mgnify:CR=1 FL=1
MKFLLIFLLVLSLEEAVIKVCSPFPPDRFTSVCDLGERLYFQQTKNRKKAYEKVFRLWSDSYYNYKRGEDFREPLVGAPGAPGDGKTRFIWTLADRKIPKGLILFQNFT